MTDTVVVGGGIAGLSLARELALAGRCPVVLETGSEVGGLVRGLPVGGTSVEWYYHYLVPGEQDILDLLAEVGLDDKIRWYESSIGVFTEGKVWPFATPFELLRFAPLSFADRIRAGFGALRLGRIDDWLTLDDVPAIDWLTDLTSPAVAEVVWEPLLRAKFGTAAPDVPAAWMWGRLHQRRDARRRLREWLGYLEGGFAQLFDRLLEDLDAHGGSVRTGARVAQVLIERGQVVGVELDGGEVIDAEQVAYAAPLTGIRNVVAEEHWDDRWRRARGLGVICLLLDLAEPLTDVFWTNVCDPDVPFGGIIEHTNLVPSDQYGGRHVVYLSRYFPDGDPLQTVDLEAEAARWVDALVRRFGLRERPETAGRIFRTDYGAPLVTTPYRDLVPPETTHIDGLYLHTTAQIYPHDRGMSEAIMRSRSLAPTMVADAARASL